MEAILTDCVHNSLRHFVYSNAVFMRERLCAEFPFEMDLLSEAEAALCPPNEPSVEVPSGAAGYYLLGLIDRSTVQTKSAVDHFKQALAIDPLFWTAYKELCTLGVAEEAGEVFGEAAAVCIQKQYLPDGRPLQNSHPSCDDQNFNANKSPVSAEDSSLRQVKHMLANNTRDVQRSNLGTASTRCASQSLKNGGATIHLTQYNTPSPVATQDCHG